MLTFDQFITKWAGRGIDTDGAYGFQCLDLMHQYILECLGLPYSVLSAPAAKYVWYNFSNLNGSSNFTKITNTPNGIPLKGDIMLWDGLYGHVAVLRDADLYHFNSFDQNYPVGSLSHIQYHDYTNVLGWLHPKGIGSAPYSEHQALVDIKGIQYASIDDSTARARTKEILVKVGV
jgi:hypothetical protein